MKKMSIIATHSTTDGAFQIGESRIRDPQQSLGLVQGYTNEKVVRRIARDFSIPIEEAKATFTETLRFLYLCGAYHGPFAPSPRIDDGWHTFLLFTEDYAEFCVRCFGRHIHHRPHDDLADAALDGSMIRRTRGAARVIYGQLSPIWRYSAAADCCDSCGCESCSGSSGG